MRIITGISTGYHFDYAGNKEYETYTVCISIGRNMYLGQRQHKNLSNAHKALCVLKRNIAKSESEVSE